jgi:pimeloyl-ACP methyl ester carboxylesterase
MNIIYVHGNQSTGQSFNFIRSHLASHASLVLEYDSQNGFYRNHHDMLERIKHVEDIFFIGHSLGGIHALHLANALVDNVLGAVTLSTPYGGSKAAEMVQFLLPFNKVVQDIQPLSAPILEANAFPVAQPWVNIVTTAGHSPFMPAANDGVVTLESMRHRQDIRVIEVASNHYEVLLNYEAVRIIKYTIEEVESQAMQGIGMDSRSFSY